MIQDGPLREAVLMNFLQRDDIGAAGQHSEMAESIHPVEAVRAATWYRAMTGETFDCACDAAVEHLVEVEAGRD